MVKITPRIAPFRALTFDVSRAGRLETLIAPPYDLIDKACQDELYARSPYNVVRLELNRAEDRYADAAATMADWRARGILRLAPRPALYHYTQTFELDGRRLTRTAVFARIRLDEFGAGTILPHERTFPKAKEDRLRLLVATRANLSPIFGLYPAGDAALAEVLSEIARRDPEISANDDLGVRNEVRAIDDAGAISVIQRALADARILIADGHHRYETALEYRRRRRAAEPDAAGAHAFDYVMIALVRFDDPGLVILPTHRVARRLDSAAAAAFDERARAIFAIEQVANAETLRAAMAKAERGALGVALRNGGFRLIRLRDRAALNAALPDSPPAVRELDVSILHALVFDRIFGLKPDAIRAGGNLEYTIDARGALAAVDSGAADGAFLMAPPTVADVEKVCASGATMPEKSTYFHPKLATGLLINPLEDGDSGGA
ncbi:DUF1015 domain-containing protein [bacterium]|nr:DUF1015 domain-containing protein [bacterium]